MTGLLEIAIIIYLLLTLAVGFYSSKKVKHTQDFTLAGRSLPALVVGVTIFATWFGPELIMGIPTLFINEGIQGVIIDQFGNSLCLILVGTFYARKMYALRITTINDFFRLRYGKSLEMLTTIVNILTYFSWIAAQFLALALLFQLLLGMPLALGIALSAGFVLTYTYVGGMWAVSITDVFQSVVIVIGLLVLAMTVLSDAGGLTYVLHNTPEGFYRLFPKGGGFYDWTDHISKWIYVGLGAIAAQEVYQRVLSAKGAKSGAQGAYISAGLLFFIGALPLVIGLASSQLYPELMQVNDGQSIIPEMVNTHMGIPLKILFFGALISAILSTSSGALLAPATIIGENLIRPAKKEITDAQLLRYTRLSVVLVAIISAVWAYMNTSIHELVVNSIIPMLVCIVVPFTLGLYWKKTSVVAVWWGIITSASVWTLCSIFETRIDAALVGMITNILITVGVSYWSPDNSHARYVLNKTSHLQQD